MQTNSRKKGAVNTMTITVDMLQLLSFAGGLLVFFLGAVFSLGRILLSQLNSHMDKRFSSLEAAIAKGNEESLRIERELMQLKADLPNTYVRREDFSLSHSEIKIRIDSLTLKIENILLKGIYNHD
jgi:hypothetical protein